MPTATTTTIVSDRKQLIRLSEFSLIELKAEEGNLNIAGRLRFPPLCARAAIREIIALLVEHHATIISQQCIGDRTATTGWSSLVFEAPVPTYQQLLQTTRPSNLKVVRESTLVLLQQLALGTSSTACKQTTMKAEEVETKIETDIAEWLTISQTESQQLNNSANIAEDEWAISVEAEIVSDNSVTDADLSDEEFKLLMGHFSSSLLLDGLATEDELKSYKKQFLQKLATAHNISGRSKLKSIKNLVEALKGKIRHSKLVYC